MAKTSQRVCIRVALCLHFTNALSYSTYNNNLELNPNSGFVNKEHNVPAKLVHPGNWQDVTLPSTYIVRMAKEPSYMVVSSLRWLYVENIEGVK